jgi:hypothetical protein
MAAVVIPAVLVAGAVAESLQMLTTLFQELVQLAMDHNIAMINIISIRQMPTVYLDQDLDQTVAVRKVAGPCAVCSQAVAV